MPKDEPADGAPDRLRLSGAIVAALGAIAFVVVLARLTTAPGTTKHALDETMVAIRWGIFLALACSAALTVAGLRLLRAPRELARTPRAERAPRRERASRTDRPPRNSAHPANSARPGKSARPATFRAPTARPGPTVRPSPTAGSRRPRGPMAVGRPRPRRTGGLTGPGRADGPSDRCGTSRPPAGSTCLTDRRTDTERRPGTRDRTAIASPIVRRTSRNCPVSART